MIKTTISISKDTLTLLKSQKITKRESYEEVLIRIINKERI